MIYGKKVKLFSHGRPTSKITVGTETYQILCAWTIWSDNFVLDLVIFTLFLILHVTRTFIGILLVPVDVKPQDR